MGKSGKKIDILVSLEDEHVDRIESISKRLRDEGMSVAEVLGNSGLITGSAAADVLPSLKKVPGVAAVEPDQQFTAGPIDASES